MQTVKKVQCDVDEKFGIASDLLHKLQQDIPLELVKNLKMVESFIKHIKHSQHVKNNCGALYLMSFITAAKFLHARESLKIMMRWIGYLTSEPFKTNTKESMLFWNTPKELRTEGPSGLSFKN